MNDELVTAVHQLKDRAAWVERLTAWADKCPELVDAHRPSYLAWHCQGRMALRVRRTRSGLVVSAGVHSSAAGKAPHKQVLEAQLSAEQFHRIVAAASGAIADRVGRLDVANAEHQLQERLAE
ncbi:MAG: hypothetical protein H0T19_06120, partial [Thermoleophilaceae bacterium]|nr:hypothetical protein [Thermoleophilaceae bacterium]